MSSAVVTFQQPGSNKLALCVPVLNCGLTLAEIITKDVPSGCPYQIVDLSLLPTDATFFDAFIYVDNPLMPVDVDQQIVNNIWKDVWRETREPILQRLDVEWMRALEASNTALCQDITDKKQILRDVTDTPLPTKLDGQNLDEYLQSVKNVWPECLNW